MKRSEVFARVPPKLCSIDALYCFAARSASFVLASALSILVLLYPQVVASAPGEVQHGALTLLMWGIAAGFVHGVGFVPRNKILRFALGPLVGLPVMTLSAMALWLNG